MYCSDCQFFKDDARCNLSKQDVGYFQKACGSFQPAVAQTPTESHLRILSAKDYQPDPNQNTMEKEQATQTKVCSKCGRELPIENFTRGRYGPTSVCKECKAEIMRQNAKKKEEKVGIGVVELGRATDEELMAELQARGYGGTLSKIVKYDLTPRAI